MSDTMALIYKELLVPLTCCIFLYTKVLKLKDSPIWLYLRKQSMLIFYLVRLCCYRAEQAKTLLVPAVPILMFLIAKSQEKELPLAFCLGFYT